jgi:hypothetical protein
VELSSAWSLRGVDLRQPLARAAQKPHELLVIGLLLLVRRDALRFAAVLEPALQSHVLHRDRERLIEPRIIAHVNKLVSELVENHRRELIRPVAQHGAHHRVGKLAESGIRRHSLHDDVVTPAFQSRGIGLGALLVEVAAVGHAACDGEAPVLGHYRERRRGHHVPHDIGPVDVDIGAITVVVGEPELLGGELAGFAHLAQLAHESLRCRRIVDHLHDRLALVHDVPFAGPRLHEIHRTSAPAESAQRDACEREPQPAATERDGGADARAGARPHAGPKGGNPSRLG